MTKEEKRLWYDFLKLLPIAVNRQKMLGEFIVDFYCASAKLVIEIDGSQHYDEENTLQDLRRDDYLQSLGLTVLRYTNRDINERPGDEQGARYKVLRYSNRDINERFTDVCSDIYKCLNI